MYLYQIYIFTKIKKEKGKEIMNKLNGGYTMLEYKTGQVNQTLLKQIYDANKPVLVFAYNKIFGGYIEKIENKYFIQLYENFQTFSISGEYDGDDFQIWLKTSILNVEDIDVDVVKKIECDLAITDETAIAGQTYEVLGGYYREYTGVIIHKDADNNVAYYEFDLTDATNVVIG